MNSDSEEDNSIQAPSNEIDQLTMSLLMNKQTYNKYISKQDPEKARILQDHNNEILKYKEKILQITNNKLNDLSLQITNDIDNSFDAYIKTVIHHFQQKKTENANQYNDDKEDDMMFEKIHDEEVSTQECSSYWGKHKVMKQNYLSNDFFCKTKYK
jgi:hypothetical protein